MRVATLLRRKPAAVLLATLCATSLVRCGARDGESHRDADATTSADTSTTGSAEATAKLCPGVAAHGQHTSCDGDDRKLAPTKDAGALGGGDAAETGGQGDDPAKPGDNAAADKAADKAAAADPTVAPETTAAPVPPDTVDKQPTTPPTTAPTPAPTAAPTTPPGAKVVEFHIEAGTGKGPWNAQADTLVVKVGQTVHVVNDDTVVHRLHTNGAPCPHGPNFAPGATFDCVASKAFDPAGPAGPVYDHIAGTSAQFWLKVVP